MKLQLAMIDGQLVPIGEQSERAFKKLPRGEVFDCLIDGERVRSNPQNARYWAQLHELQDMIPESWQGEFARAMLDSLSLEQVDVATLHEYIKMRAGVTSIAFDRLSHADACEFYRLADEEIERMKILADEMR